MVVRREQDVAANGMLQGDLYAVVSNLTDVVNELQTDHATFKTVVDELKTDYTALLADVTAIAASSPATLTANTAVSLASGA